MAKTKTRPKTLKELYLEEKSKPTAAAQFIASAAAALNRDEGTIRQWLCGTCMPNKDIVPEVEKYFGQPIETLFPNYKDK